MEAKKIVLFVPDARSTAPRPAGEFNDNNDVADNASGSGNDEPEKKTAKIYKLPPCNPL